MQFRIPGPTPLPEEIRQAMARQMVSHRGPELDEMIHEVVANLKEMFQTKGDVLVLTSSGTGGMEAAVVNTLSPGDKVLCLASGAFGERFGDIAERYGADVSRVGFEWGQPVEPGKVRQALSQDAGIKAVQVTHNETSTGVTNDLASISAVVKEFDKLLLVDAISSLGAVNLPTDEWGCDVVVTGSQKAWMSPPGLAMVSVSERGWQANAEAKMPRYYWDLARAKKYFEERGQTPWTPGITTMYALCAALRLLKREGLPNIIARHARVGARVREGVKSLGLELFANEDYASNTVTAVKAPDGVDVKRLLAVLREEHDTILAGGQQKLDGKIFRIGHLGHVSESDVDAVIDALRAVLPKVGFRG